MFTSGWGASLVLFIWSGWLLFCPHPHTSQGLFSLSPLPFVSFAVSSVPLNHFGSKNLAQRGRFPICHSVMMWPGRCAICISENNRNKSTQGQLVIFAFCIPDCDTMPKVHGLQDYLKNDFQLHLRTTPASLSCPKALRHDDLRNSFSLQSSLLPQFMT